eukprot:TRINITY_DN36455_c0_g1_i1.p1 TRINITY_DN36455_c0_g1~~TRINITY_DN36455_c0_g1_i1.p1  ORF type:complete len:939 (-),score=159.64 TRINITY_DN36455_c0_g1_i1:78-2894(-)
MVVTTGLYAEVPQLCRLPPGSQVSPRSGASTPSTGATTPVVSARSPRPVATPRQRPVRQPQQHDNLYHRIAQQKTYRQQQLQEEQQSHQFHEQKSTPPRFSQRVPSPNVGVSPVTVRSPVVTEASACRSQGAPSVSSPPPSESMRPAAQGSPTTPVVTPRSPPQVSRDVKSPRHGEVGPPPGRKKHLKSIGHYMLGTTIGQGTFGKVKLGEHVLTGEKVAVKVLEKEKIVDVADVERVAREVHILKSIRHRNVVRLFEIIETARQLFLIMEYAAGGELFDYIVACGRVPELEACQIFRQIIDGIEEIHRCGVVHRDLKPENLLLDEHKRVKIVDFGLSNTFKEGQLLKTACGSPCYAAPEMIAGKEYVPALCDVWSCGVILYAMICGVLPFEDANTSQLYRKILAAEYTMPGHVSDEGSKLITGLLTTDPEQRLDTRAIRRQPWFQLVEDARPDGPVQQIIEEDILRDLEQFDFPLDYARRCIVQNKHNHVTTTYHLLVQRKRRLLDQVAKMELGQDCTADRIYARFASDHVGRTVAAGESGNSAASQNAEPSRRQATFQPPARVVDRPATPPAATRAEEGVQAVHAERRASPSQVRPATPRSDLPQTTGIDAASLAGIDAGGAPPGRTATPDAPDAAAAVQVRKQLDLGAGSKHPAKAKASPEGAQGAAGNTASSATTAAGTCCSSSCARSCTPQGAESHSPDSRQASEARTTASRHAGTSPIRAPQCRAPTTSPMRAAYIPPRMQAFDSARRPVSPRVALVTARAVATQRSPGSPQQTQQHRQLAGDTPRVRTPPGRRPAVAVADISLQGAYTPRERPHHVAERSRAESSRSQTPQSAREAREDRRACYDTLRTFSKQPHVIMQELQRVFAAQRIASKQVSGLAVKCQWLSLRFDVEVAALDRYGSIHALRARRLAGEPWQYKAVCNRILAEIRIT